MEISRRDWQLLSEYIDGELPAEKKSRLETRLDSEQALQDALHRMRNTRRLLRSAPVVKAPRNFTLTPEMVGRRSQTSYFPLFRLATAIASFLLIAVLIFDFTGLPVPLQGAERPARVREEMMLESADQESARSAQETPDAEVEMEAEAPKAEMEEEPEQTEGVTALGEQPATPSPTPLPTETIPPPAPSPPGPGRGLSLIRTIEIILAGLVFLFMAGMLLTRKKDGDVS